jgi:hypothetical protein
VNETDSAPGGWQVAASSNTILNTFYTVIHSASKEEVQVSISGKNRRGYAWKKKGEETIEALARQKLPPATRREIDRAIIRYLTSVR